VKIQELEENQSLKFHHQRENRTDYSIGIVKGVEADNRIFNSELRKYSKALTKFINNYLEMIYQLINEVVVLLMTIIVLESSIEL